jgi:hypothetical protein
MSTSKKTLVGGLIGAVIAVSLIAAGAFAFSGTSGFFGLGGSSSTTGYTNSNTTTGTSSGSGFGTLQVSMIDPPNVPPEVTAVYINYSSIEVHVASAGNQSGWYNVTTGPQTANLTSMIANSKLLGSTKLPSGTYNIVRFNVTSALVTVNGKNYTASVPSGKLQAAITGGVDVKPSQTSALLIDISPKVTGNLQAGYTLVPSANAQPANPSSTSTSSTSS